MNRIFCMKLFVMVIILCGEVLLLFSTCRGSSYYFFAKLAQGEGRAKAKSKNLPICSSEPPPNLSKVSARRGKSKAKDAVFAFIAVR